jgi:hypothetical protein
MRRLALAAAAALLAAGCSAGKITAPRYVLSFGVGDYGYTYPGDDDEDHQDPTLLCPKPDAISLCSLLESQGYQRKSLLFDDTATKENIRHDILDLSSVEPDAIVVIFFSGHGTYIAAGTLAGYLGAYLAPYGAVDSSNGFITSDTANSLISPEELGNWLTQAGMRNVIVILNTCYSGAFVDPGSSIDTAPQNYGIYDEGTVPFSGILSALGSIGGLVSKNARDSGSPGPIVISAAGSHESSYESYSPEYEGHGILPFYLFKAASGGDFNSDGFVTATEAYKYVSSQIRLNWNSTRQFIYDSSSGQYADFMPHISGGARDLVLFSN